MNADLLIAESDTALLDVVTQFFRRLGYTVDTAAGGLECLNKLRRHPYLLLVLDRDLPWGGGEGVLAVMRDEPSLARIPVILTSTAVCPAPVAPPVAEVLNKPFSLHGLLQRVRCLTELVR
jgi:DNA-binding response OmpR family regulator